MESAASISPRGRAASWYTFRAYLEKHLPYSIDESSRKHKNRALNIRNEKEKKRQILTTSSNSSLSTTATLGCCNSYPLKPRQRPQCCYARLMAILIKPRLNICKLANGTLDGEVYHTKD